MRSLIWAFAIHKCPETFYLWHGPFNTELQISWSIHTIFFLFLHENMLVRTRKKHLAEHASTQKCLSETLLMSTHIFSWKNQKKTSHFWLKKCVLPAAMFEVAETLLMSIHMISWRNKKRSVIFWLKKKLLICSFVSTICSY